MEVLILNPDLDFWNSDPKIHFWANLGPKSQSCPFSLKIGSHGISRMLIFIPTLVFWISHPKFIFGKISAKKVVKVVRFFWKLAHMVSREDANSYSKIFFRISNSKFLFGQIWAKKVKTWKLAPVVSRGCWFLLQYLFSEFQTRNRFLGRSAPKKSNLFILPENWHTWYLEDADSYFNICFLNFKT